VFNTPGFGVACGGGVPAPASELIPTNPGPATNENGRSCGWPANVGWAPIVTYFRSAETLTVASSKAPPNEVETSGSNAVASPLKNGTCARHLADAINRKAVTNAAALVLIPKHCIFHPAKRTLEF